MSDPEFWAKILPSLDLSESAATHAIEVHGRRQPRHSKILERYGVQQHRYDDEDDWPVEQDGKPRRVAERKRYCEEESDKEDMKRDGGLRKRYFEHATEGDDENLVDTKLWAGAMSAGWKVQVRGHMKTGHYWYISPTGDRFQSKSEALLHASNDHLQPAQTARRPHVFAEGSEPIRLSGTRLLSRQAKRQAVLRAQPICFAERSVDSKEIAYVLNGRGNSRARSRKSVKGAQDSRAGGAASPASSDGLPSRKGEVRLRGSKAGGSSEARVLQRGTALHAGCSKGEWSTSGTRRAARPHGDGATLVAAPKSKRKQCDDSD